MAHIEGERELGAYLDEKERRLEEITTGLARLWFQQYVEKKRPAEIDALEEEQSRLLLDPELAEIISEFAGRVQEPLTARRVMAWQKALLAAQINVRPEVFRLQNEIAARQVAYQPEYNHFPTDMATLRHIMRQDADPLHREEAWLAMAPLAKELEPQVGELLTLRNQLAQSLGYRTYVDLALYLQGLTREDVENALKGLATRTQDLYMRCLHEESEHAGLLKIMPWDIMYLLERADGASPAYFPAAQAERKMAEFLRGFGVELAGTGVRLVVTDIPYNGLTMTIEAPRDIRVLVNPRDGLGYYSTIFHEYGHALHAYYARPQSYILRHEAGVFGEAMAEVVAYFVNYPEWLAAMGLSAAEIRSALKARLLAQFSFLRQRSANALFEYLAYDNPSQNLNALYAAVQSQVVGHEIDPRPQWAANAWYTSYPVYWQNYVLAEVIASQTHRALQTRFGHVLGNPAAFAYVRDQYWAPAGGVDWQDKVRVATGDDWGIEALVGELLAAGAEHYPA